MSLTGTGPEVDLPFVPTSKVCSEQTSHRQLSDSDNTSLEINPETINEKLKQNEVHKKQFGALYQECLRVQIQNEKYAEKLYRIQKVTRRLQKERRFLMKKLDEFGDDYRSAKIKSMIEEERIRNFRTSTNEGNVTKTGKKALKKKMKGIKRLQNAPKKPSNAFLMFCQKNRSLVQEEHHKLNQSEIGRQEMTKRLAELWKETTAENKKAYYEMYEKDKERYVREMKKFETEVGSNSHEASIEKS